MTEQFHGPYHTILLFRTTSGRVQSIRGMSIAASRQEAVEETLKHTTAFVRQNLTGADAISVREENELLGRYA